MEFAEQTLKQALTRTIVEAGEPFSYWRRRLSNLLAQVSADLLALLTATLFAATLRYWWTGELALPRWNLYLLPAWFCGAALLRLLPSWGLGPVEELRRLTILVTLVFGSTATALLLNRSVDTVSIATLVAGFGVTLIMVPLVRINVKRFLIRFDWWGIPTVVYGGGRTGTQILRLLQQERGLGYLPVGVLDDDATLRGRRVEGVDVLGGTNIVHLSAPVAVLAMPSIGRERSIEMLEGPLAGYRTVIVIPDLMEAPSLWVRPRDLKGMLGLEITCNLCSPFARVLKRTSDIALVTLAAPLWIPLCLGIALLIWLEDRGHPLFLQHRLGEDGQAFDTWKFRTMFPNAEAILKERLERDEALREEWTTNYKLKEDPRITRVGKVLRRLSLDELPQLINVLRGEMSLVGPRPLPHYHHQALPPRVQELRERVKPGITGLWQVSGRSDAGNAGMEQWDPYYVRNWSLWLDCIILIRTVRIVLNGSGAY